MFSSNYFVINTLQNMQSTVFQVILVCLIAGSISGEEKSRLNCWATFRLRCILYKTTPHWPNWCPLRTDGIFTALFWAGFFWEESPSSGSLQSNFKVEGTFQLNFSDFRAICSSAQQNYRLITAAAPSVMTFKQVFTCQSGMESLKTHFSMVCWWLRQIEDFLRNFSLKFFEFFF